MSEFKIRPTPTLIRLILEQLEANGVDTNQKSLAIGANLHSETQKEPYFFLRGLSMPLTAGVGFISEKPTEKNALCFLQSCGFLTGNAFDTTVGATLHLEAMRNVISQGTETAKSEESHLSKAGKLLAERRNAGSNKQIA
jgi:hypothetical protein